MATIAEITDELMPTVKVAVRTMSNLFDPEIEAAVSAAVADMKRVGVSDACFDEDSDYYPIVRQAVVVYCKAHFGGDNPNEEMGFWRTSYLMHLDDLLNSGANGHAEEVDPSEGEGE